MITIFVACISLLYAALVENIHLTEATTSTMLNQIFSSEIAFRNSFSALFLHPSEQNKAVHRMQLKDNQVFPDWEQLFIHSFTCAEKTPLELLAKHPHLSPRFCSSSTLIESSASFMGNVTGLLTVHMKDPLIQGRVAASGAFLFDHLTVEGNIQLISVSAIEINTITCSKDSSVILMSLGTIDVKDTQHCKEIKRVPFLLKNQSELKNLIPYRSSFLYGISATP